MKNEMCIFFPLLECTSRIALRFVLGTTLLAYPTHGQTAQSQPEQLAAAIASIKSGRFNNVHVETVARAGAAQGVLPELEQQFRDVTDIAKKDRIANALVKLGDKDDTYWKFLLGEATLAVESDLPDPTHDSQGNVMEQHLSPEIIAWAQAHHVDVSTAAESALIGLPGKVLLLGNTGDPRGLPLLRRALQSHNPMIVVVAAKGLAQLQDKDSIPLIIEACQRAPKGVDGAIAEASLLFFDDPRAQSAVDTYVPKDRAKLYRDLKAQGLKPFGH